MFYRSANAIIIGFFILTTLILFPRNANGQDTVTIQTFTWDSSSRAGWFTFPDYKPSEIARINMIYNMRCHDAVVGNGQTGCKEWDYSCNTFITDTNRIDSALAFQAKYVIAGFNGNEYFYSNSPTMHCASFDQVKTSYDSIANSGIYTVGQYQQDLAFAAGNSKYYFLYRADELIQAGMAKGAILGMNFKLLTNNSKIEFMKIRLTNSTQTHLREEGVDQSGLQEVYFSNANLDHQGLNTIIFHTPFNWDGKSSILLELSYNNSEPGQLIVQSDTADRSDLVSTEADFSVLQNGGEAFSMDARKLKNISSEITIAFWSYGLPESLPVNTTMFEGTDAAGRRQINAHLPWSNGSIYWDCGNDGSGYDRIEKAASPDEYAGQWTHWAFTKNAIKGTMKIYRNGKLWQSGTGKNKNISIDKMNFAGNIDKQLSYFGRISQFCIWNAELDSNAIMNWNLQPGSAIHPYYSNLLYYFPLNDKAQNTITDIAHEPAPATATGYVQYHEEKGRDKITGFKNASKRPVTQWIQGTANGIHKDTSSVLESFENPVTTVCEYEIRNGRAVVKQNHLVYPAGSLIIRNQRNDSVGVKTITPDGSYQSETIRYQYYSNAKFELLSLVSPYGINLDLTKDGKTFVFDVTDYAPILRGSKRLSMELGGENQEEINLKFQFIKGKPTREVREIQNVYTFNRGYFGNILRDEVFEPRTLLMPDHSTSYKIRTTITGHEQNGEFTNRSHYISVKSNKATKKFDFDVWKECADNPIYPQGGTWIFDRAGWCPGAPSDVHHFNITPYVIPGENAVIDYGLNGANLDQANYLVSCQLVSYGPANFNIDAGIESIIRPNSDRVEFERFNPSCSRPAVVIKNYGTTVIKSLRLKYQVSGTHPLEYEYLTPLLPEESAQVDLPVDDISFWTGSADNIFSVSITSVNGAADENSGNDKMQSRYKLVRSFDFDPIFEIRTNNADGDNSYRISDINGKVLIDKPNLPATTTIQEFLQLPNGCYTLEVTDLEQNGLSFWYYPDLGSGSSSFKKKINTVLAPVQNFKSDFGAGFRYDFIINKVNSVGDESIIQLLSLYPNPATEEVNIELRNPMANTVNLSLMDVSGRVVKSCRLDRQNEHQTFNLKLNGISSGLYTLRISSESNTITKKITIH